MSDYKRHYMWNNSDWKEFLDYQNERCPYAGDFSRVVRKNFDPLWGTGISEEDEENLPEFTVQISGTKTIDCTGYITVKALNEEMASDMVKQQKINFNDIDWCDDNGTEYYNDIDVVSVARTLYNGDF